MNKKYKEIFTPYVARRLLRMGNPICDIKPMKENKDKTILPICIILTLSTYGLC